MIFKEYKVLSNNFYIKSLYHYDCIYPEKYKFFIPDGNLELMLSNQPISITSNKKTIINNENDIFWGQIRFTGNMESPVPYQVFGIKFQPWVLPVISLGQNKKLIDHLVPASQVFGNRLLKYIKDFFAQWDFDAPCELAIARLSDDMKQQFNPAPFTKYNFLNVMEIIGNSEGIITLPEVLQHSRQSFRTLQYDFHNYIGLSPKEYVDLVRFRKLCMNLKSQKKILDSALEFGFYDQAHFNKKFKTVCHKTPAAFLKEKNLLLSNI